MGNAIGENNIEYLLHFENNQGLQDALLQLLRNGSLTSVQVETKPSLPVWVVPGVFILDEDPRPRRLAELIECLADLTPFRSGKTGRGFSVNGQS